MDDPSRPTFNNLFIDLNGLIHRAVTAARLQESRCTADFLSEFFRSVDLLVQLARPTDLLFIAADGPAPFAKTVQQRANRFASAGGSFDSCAISPGTEFMAELHSEILRFIADQRRSDIVWSRPRVIYSGSFVPGEGDHKIMEFIRGQREDPDWPPDQVHCFYSTDADFVFLALQTHEPYCCLIRECDSVAHQRDLEAFEARPSTQNWGYEAFDIVHISLVREYLALDFGSDDLEGLVDDFISIVLLIENDFIPDFHEIDIKAGDFDAILSIYRSIGGRLVDRGRFIKPILKGFLTKVCEFCREKFGKEHRVKEPQLTSVHATANREWLASKYPDADFEQLRQEMATGLLEAFWWVLQYYACGCPSWDWTYNFHFSPPLEYVLPFVEDFEPMFQPGEPNPPFLQQLATLPPRSTDMLPASLRPLLRRIVDA
jgi:5'-3' exonuclease